MDILASVILANGGEVGNHLVITIVLIGTEHIAIHHKTAIVLRFKGFLQRL